MGINESGRKKLVIVKADERRTVKGDRGDFDIQDFFAKIEGEEGQGKYFTSSKNLFDHIKVDTTIDCDVEAKKTGKNDPDGNPYWNRKVTQIYVDGKPVSEKKGFGGGYQRQSSDAELKAKAKNTALMQAVEWLKPNPNATLKNALHTADAFYNWLIDGTIPVPPPLSTPEKTQPAISKAPEPSDSLTKTEPGVEIAYKHDPTTIKDKTTFQKYCASDFGLLTPLAICATLKIDSMQDIADYADSYKDIARIKVQG